MDRTANPIPLGDSSYDNKPILNKRPYAIVGAGAENPSPLAALAHLVNIEVEEGYQPIGAPFFEPDRRVWCQALYKPPSAIVAPPPINPNQRKR